MKILVIQITRLGDILCTMPALSALRRQNPQAEIHFLVRKRFAQAVEGHSVVNHLWRLDSQKILGPLLGDNASINNASAALQGLIFELRAEKFDRIVNLSFSPASSFITHLIAQNQIPVLGYTRTSDLYLHIPDQSSRFFKAHVGLDKSNRVHISDILALVAGTELTVADATRDPIVASEERVGVVCHLGSSQAQKTWPAAYWISLLQKLNNVSGEKITLVGGAEEKSLADNIVMQVGAGSNILNLVGQTSFNELYSIIGAAKLYIGADSGPLHIANFAQCLTLNLSVGDVRFWETGPTTLGSRVLVSRVPEYLSSDTVFENAREMLNNALNETPSRTNGRHTTAGSTPQGYIECVRSRGVRYVVHPQANVAHDSWPLVEWLHFGGPAPALSVDMITALAQIKEICVIADQQLETFYKTPNKIEVVGVLDRLDQLLEIMRANLAPLSPLIEEFKVDKENIPPASREEVFFLTKRCYQKLAQRAGLLESRKGEDVERHVMA